MDEVARRYGVTPDQLDKILGAQERKRQKNRAKRARKRGGATGEDGNYEIIEEGPLEQNGEDARDRVGENRRQGTAIPPSGFGGEQPRNQGSRNETGSRSNPTSSANQRPETPAPSGILRRPSRGIGERRGDDGIPPSSLNDSTPQRRPLVLTTEEHEIVMNIEQQSRSRSNRERTSVVTPAPNQRKEASPHVANPFEDPELDDLPELEDMPTRPAVIPQITRDWNSSNTSRPGNTPRPEVWVNLPVGSYAEARRDLSEYAFTAMKEAIADGSTFTPNRINGFPKRSEAINAMISLATHKMAVESGLEITNSLFANPGRLVCLTMKALQSIIQRPDQARQWVKKLHTTDPVSPNLNDVTPLQLKHLVGNQHRVLSGSTPPAEECIKFLQMVLKRFHPDDYEEIDQTMQAAGLPASTYVRFITMQGEFSQWIGRAMGNELSSFIPRIYRLGKLQEEVDEEENALLEEMSIGRSVTSFQVSESESEPQAQDSESTPPRESGASKNAEMGMEVEEFAKDLHPLDPISTLVERAEKEGREIIIPMKLLRDHSVLNGFEIFPYEQDEVPSTSPIAEVNYPYEALDHRYHGVTEAEAKQTLVDKVLVPYLNSHFSEVQTLLKWHYGAKPYQELTMLCGAPSQMKVSIKELGLAIVVPPKKTQHKEQVSSMDPVYALPKIPTRSILQVEMRENMNPEAMVEQLGEVFEAMSPGQEVTIEGSWEVLPNLAESPIGSEFNPKTIRIQVNSSFEMESLLTIKKEDSQEASRVMVALQSTRTEVLCSYPSSWVEVAIFPEVLPEHNLRSMTRFVDSLPRNSNMPDQYIIAWSDHYRYASSVKCATMYAPRELVTGLQALLERNSPIKYKGMSITPILSSEKSEVSYYQDVFQKHTAMTQGRQVLQISGVPQWLKLESLKITAEVLQREVQEHQSGWTVADLLMRLTPEGIVNFRSDGVFTEMLPGNRGDSIVLCFHNQDAMRAWKCQDEVMRIVSTAGGSASQSKLKIEMIPSIEFQEEDNRQDDMAHEHEKEEESSVSSSESSEPPQRKHPGHESNFESQPPARQLESLMNMMQERAESMANLEGQIEKLTVSMTSMSTDISDLKTQSEANVKATVVATMTEQQLENFINERCVPKFVDQVIAKQRELKMETTEQQKEMLSQVSSKFAGVVREELHLSYPTAEQHLVSTFRKCLQEAVREMKKATGQDVPSPTSSCGLPKDGNDEDNQPRSLSPPSQEYPALYKGWEEEASRGADRTLGSALEILQRGRCEDDDAEEDDTTESKAFQQHPSTIEFRAGTLTRQVEAGENEAINEPRGPIFEVEGEMSNLTAPNFGVTEAETATEVEVPDEPESPAEAEGERAEHDHNSLENGKVNNK
jgi:hypothetical protein